MEITFALHKFYINLLSFFFSVEYTVKSTTYLELPPDVNKFDAEIEIW